MKHNSYQRKEIRLRITHHFLFHCLLRSQPILRLLQQCNTVFSYLEVINKCNIHKARKNKSFRANIYSIKKPPKIQTKLKPTKLYTSDYKLDQNIKNLFQTAFCLCCSDRKILCCLQFAIRGPLIYFQRI